MGIRKIQQGVDALNSAAVVNRPHEDTLTNSGYNADGQDFDGFARGKSGSGSPLGAAAAARGHHYTDGAAADGRGHWRKLGSTNRSWARTHDYVHIRAYDPIADGANDDTTALTNANNAALAAGVPLYLDPATYYIDSTFTFTCDLIIPRGAKIKRNANRTVTVQGHVQVGAYYWLDSSAAGSAWATATIYALNARVLSGGVTYQCTSAHTSDASTRPGIGISSSTVWTAVGKYSFDGNRFIARYLPQWSGVVGDNATDDTVPWETFVGSVPDFATIQGTTSLQCLVNNFTFQGRSGLLFKAGGWNSDSGGGPAYATPQFRYSGADGGTLMSHLNNGQCVFDGWVFDQQNAFVGIEMTQFSGGARISSNNAFLYTAHLGGTLPDSIAMRVGHNAPGNCELNRWENTKWFGQLNSSYRTLACNGRFTGAGGTMTAGSPVISNLTFNPTTTNVPGANAKVVAGMRARIMGGGATNAGPNFFNGCLDTTVASVGTSSITLNAPAVHNVWLAWVTATSYVVGDIITSGGLIYYCQTAHTSDAAKQPGSGTPNIWPLYWIQLKGGNSTTSGPYMVFGDGTGFGLVIENQNSHWQRVYNSDFHEWRTAIVNNGGSHFLSACNFGSNNTDVSVTFNSMQCVEQITNTENSFQHLVGTGNLTTYLILGGRQANGYTLPSNGWFAYGRELIVQNVCFDNYMAFGSALYNTSGTSGTKRHLYCQLIGDGPGLSTQELGWLPAPQFTGGHDLAILWEGGDAPNDGSCSGRTRKWFILDGWNGDGLGEQIGIAYAYIKALNAAPNDANIDPGTVVLYLDGGTNHLMARVRFQNGTYGTKDLGLPT